MGAKLLKFLYLARCKLSGLRTLVAAVLLQGASSAISLEVAHDRLVVVF